VYTDFDGTVAQLDVTDAVLRRFAPEEWETIESAWRAGEIDAAACMRAALDGFLDQIELDPGFPRFVAWCAEERVPLTIVSDGVDYFAQRILEHHGLGHLPLFANHLKVEAQRYTLTHPWRAPECRAGAGVCKCAIATADSTEEPDLLVYVGDGRSDRCVATSADFLFAKDDLAAHCRRQRLPYLPFENFDQVRETLLTLDRRPKRREDECLA
jgi:2-hydroxy-3-keto-5-methylthiopentenyl-1-phosphate phosphatase